jgi:hypothetical protein
VAGEVGLGRLVLLLDCAVEVSQDAAVLGRVRGVGRDLQRAADQAAGRGLAGEIPADRSPSTLLSGGNSLVAHRVARQ